MGISKRESRTNTLLRACHMYTRVVSVPPHPPSQTLMVLRAALKTQGLRHYLRIYYANFTWKRMDSRTVITTSCVGDACVSRTSEISVRSDSPERSLGTGSLLRGCRRLRPTGRAHNQPLGLPSGCSGRPRRAGFRRRLTPCRREQTLWQLPSLVSSGALPSEESLRAKLAFLARWTRAS